MKHPNVLLILSLLLVSNLLDISGSDITQKKILKITGFFFLMFAWHIFLIFCVQSYFIVTFQKSSIKETWKWNSDRFIQKKLCVLRSEFFSPNISFFSPGWLETWSNPYASVCRVLGYKCASHLYQQNSWPIGGESTIIFFALRWLYLLFVFPQFLLWDERLFLLSPLLPTLK